MIDRQPGVPHTADAVQHLLHRVVHIHGVHIHPDGEDILHGVLAEIQGGLHQLAFFGLQAALLGDILHHVVELVLGDGAPLAAQQICRAVAQGGEQIGKGGANLHHQDQRARDGLGEMLGILLGDILGQQLRKEEHDHGEHQGGGGHRVRPPQPGRHHRGNGRCEDMTQIVADQNGRKCLIEMI